jgi:serine/threonine protein phosphatase 1
VDRNPKVRELLDFLLALLEEKPGSSAVMGNHDLALVKATGLDSEPDAYWAQRYGEAYDHKPTFESYLGRSPQSFSREDWLKDLAELREAMPRAHREFLCGLPWGVEAAGHVFLHNGLSPELEEPAHIQWELIKRRHWHGYVHPRPGTVSATEYRSTYPVWLGADKKLSAHPLPLPGKVQVSGHVKIPQPDANSVRIRIDTSGGNTEPLTACLLRDATAAPEFYFSNG